MSVQETALYGDLVLYLRDQAAKLLAETKAEEDIEAAGQRLDQLIRDWFFQPQEELYGSAPKDIIWREQLGQGNPVPPEYTYKMFDDNCPICQMTTEEIETSDHHHSHSGWNWTYCPDQALIDIYDPEGSADRWAQERLRYQPQLERDDSPAEVPTYTPPAVEDLEISPEEFMERLNRQPQVDDRLKKIAIRLIERLDCPISGGLFGPQYRRLKEEECFIMLESLAAHGVDLEALAEQVEAWPYQNVALDWVSDPEKQAYFMIKAIETRLVPADKAELVRFRQHRDFMFILGQLIPYNARLWLQGWLEGLASGERRQAKNEVGDDHADGRGIPFL